MLASRFAQILTIMTGCNVAAKAKNCSRGAIHAIESLLDYIRR